MKEGRRERREDEKKWKSGIYSLSGGERASSITSNEVVRPLPLFVSIVNYRRY